jgi:hypothetical protein
MAYSDQKFYTRQYGAVAFAADLGTATGATINKADAAQLPKFKRRTEITAIRLRCTTIPNAAATSLKLSFLNGTNTFGTAIVTTATADQWVDGVITSAANAKIAADGEPTVTVTGTATASGDSLGDFDIYFERNELHN